MIAAGGPSDGGCMSKRIARMSARVALVGLVAGFAVAVAAGPAAATAAAAAIACPSGVTWKLVMRYRAFSRYQALQSTILSVTPVFLVSDARFLQNGLDSTIDYTITSSVSKTITVSASTGVEYNPIDILKTSVSSSIEFSRTTQVGVTITTTVPARTTVYADYGVDSYYVTYTVRKWWGETHDGGLPSAGVNECFNKGDYPQQTYAPTTSEGWKLRTG
jgi:hypothetical protein